MKMTVAEIAELTGCSKSIVRTRIRQIMPEASAGQGGRTMLDKEQAFRLIETLPITNRELAIELRDGNGANGHAPSAPSEIDRLAKTMEVFMEKIIEIVSPAHQAPIKSEIEAPITVPRLSAPAPEMSSRDRLYMEHRYRCNKDMKLKAKNRSMKTMDLFVKDGEIHNLLAIALEIYGE